MASAHRKPMRLAAAALHATMAGKWPTAQEAMRRLYTECGPEGLMEAAQALCDTLIDHATGGNPESASRVQIKFWEGATGRLDDIGSDRVPPETQWAGRLIQARAAMDLDAWLAVIAELPEGESQDTGRHVGALLKVVAWQVGGLPYGYARMGVGGG